MSKIDCRVTALSLLGGFSGAHDCTLALVKINDWLNAADLRPAGGPT
jgi:hypothetical protein